MQKVVLTCLLALTLARPGFAWTDGELLIWMDADRAAAVEQIAQRFEREFGIKVRIEAPEKITDDFPIAAQAGKGPDIVIWAHDKVGEWAEAGIIAPVEVSSDFQNRFFPKAWEDVTHRKQIWSSMSSALQIATNGQSSAQAALTEAAATMLK
jgi:maltose/maltodextrin transport system substrate-binding protein